MIQMTVKNIENEILILDTNLDKKTCRQTAGFSHAAARLFNAQNMECLRAQREHALDEAKHIHEDLEFQLMEIEAKYETELEDIQNRLIKEQDNLLGIFKQRQASLGEFDRRQTEMLLSVKRETETLEAERVKLADEFKKQRAHLGSVEKRILKLMSDDDDDERADERTPSPASSSVSLSSTTNSNETSATTTTTATTTSQSPNSTRVDVRAMRFPASTPGRFGCMERAAYAQVNYANLSSQSQRATPAKSSLSQSFREILENTRLINGMCEPPPPQDVHRRAPRRPQFDSNKAGMSGAKNVSFGPCDEQEVEASATGAAAVVANTQLAVKFAELERHLAMSKVEDYTLLEQQVF
jgi:hypothetical protein